MAETPRLLTGVAHTGAYCLPSLRADFNEMGRSDECDLYAAADSWVLGRGQRVIVRDGDGLKCAAVVSGPWLGSGRFVGVRLAGDFDYSECEAGE